MGEMREACPATYRKTHEIFFQPSGNSQPKPPRVSQSVALRMLPALATLPLDPVEIRSDCRSEPQRMTRRWIAPWSSLTQITIHKSRNSAHPLLKWIWICYCEDLLEVNSIKYLILIWGQISSWNRIYLSEIIKSWTFNYCGAVNHLTTFL